jgi:hypothetical protein
MGGYFINRDTFSPVLSFGGIASILAFFRVEWKKCDIRVTGREIRCEEKACSLELRGYYRDCTYNKLQCAQ